MDGDARAGSWMLLNGTHLVLLSERPIVSFLPVPGGEAGHGDGRGWAAQMRNVCMLGNGAMGSCWALSFTILSGAGGRPRGRGNGEPQAATARGLTF